MKSDSSENGVQPWIPSHHCKRVQDLEVRMSRGFLRSLPARWFPGLAAHWLPLFHSSAIEFKVFEAVPLLSIAANNSAESARQDELEPFGSWLVEDEPVVIYTDSFSRNAILQAITPGGSRHARRIMLEYLARRIAISLRASWSGMENSQLSYDSEFNFKSFKPQAWIRVRASLNGERVVFSFGLARGLAEKLDGLWRRQILPSAAVVLSNKHYKQTSNLVGIELISLSVAPRSLPSYLKSGSLVDLEIPLSSSLTMKIGGESWVSAALCCCDDKFALETISASPSSLRVVEGATPLCVEFGTVNLDAAACIELEQPGAMVLTDLPLSDLVQLSIRGEKVGRARLVSFEGRFALSIL